MIGRRSIVDFLGDADFHALLPVDGFLYGAESSGRIWRRDASGSWAELGEVEARDLAVERLSRSSGRHRRPSLASVTKTFLVDHGGAWWVAVHGGAISRSDDQGATWVDAYVPPAGS